MGKSCVLIGYMSGQYGPICPHGFARFDPTQEKIAWSRLTEANQFVTETMSYNNRGPQLVLVITDLKSWRNYNWKYF